MATSPNALVNMNLVWDPANDPKLTNVRSTTGLWQTLKAGDLDRLVNPDEPWLLKCDLGALQDDAHRHFDMGAVSFSSKATVRAVLQGLRDAISKAAHGDRVYVKGISLQSESSYDLHMPVYKLDVIPLEAVP